MEIRNLLQIAYALSETSSDSSTRNGALLVDSSGRILTTGVNAFVGPSFYLDPRNHERPRKYKVTEHAERAAIFNAARQGICTQGLLLVCPWASCPDCARAIVLAGIIKVIGHKQAYDKTPPRWVEEVEQGFEILRDGNVEYQFYDGIVGGIKNLFDGEYWEP